MEEETKFDVDKKLDVVETMDKAVDTIEELKKENESLIDKNDMLNREIDRIKDDIDLLVEANKQLSRENEKYEEESITRLKDKYGKLYGIVKLLMGYAFDEEVFAQEVVPKGQKDHLEIFNMK